MGVSVVGSRVDVLSVALVVVLGEVPANAADHGVAPGVAVVAMVPGKSASERSVSGS